MPKPLKMLPAAALTLGLACSVSSAFAQQTVNAICSTDRPWCDLAASDFQKATGIRVVQTHRPTGEALVGHPLGNPKEGHYELVLDDELRLQVLDIQRQQIPLVLVERSAIPEVVLEPWLQALDELLDGLAPVVRRAFLWSQLEGLGYREIAERLKVSERTVKRYMAQAYEHCLLVDA